jgi:hypothetical protein
MYHQDFVGGLYLATICIGARPGIATVFETHSSLCPQAGSIAGLLIKRLETLRQKYSF